MSHLSLKKTCLQFKDIVHPNVVLNNITERSIAEPRFNLPGSEICRSIRADDKQRWLSNVD